jgi:hypothetical protein
MFRAFRSGMDESLKGLGDVPVHRLISIMLVIVPLEGEANVLVATPILGTFVFLSDDGNEIVDIFFVSISYAKVVDDKSEHQVAVEMFSQAGGDRAWYISKWVEKFSEAIVCKLACLREPVHSLTHFSVDVTIRNVVFKLV